MPLVKTPMIAPTKIYDKFPTISPAQAADVVIKALVEKPHELNTVLGNAGAVAHTVAPKAAFRVLNMAYPVDRTCVVQGKRVSVRVDLGGSRFIKKQNTQFKKTE